MVSITAGINQKTPFSGEVLRIQTLKNLTTEGTKNTKDIYIENMFHNQYYSSTVKGNWAHLIRNCRI
jgi:hypothetical protein